MQFSHLKYFVETVKCRSINKAALILHVDPSTLSVALRSLENELGYQLLIRSRNGTSPTVQGAKVFEDAQKMLELYESWKLPMQTTTDQEVIRIATSHLAYNTFCNDISIQFTSEKIPLVPIFQVGFNHTVLNMDTDFFISSFCNKQEYNLLCTLISQRALQSDVLIPNDPLVIYINKHHPLAKKASASINDLIDISHIDFSETFPMEPDDPRALPATFRVNEHAQILKLVEENKGYALLPSLCQIYCKRLMLHSITTVPLSNYDLTTTIYFAHPPYSSLSRNMKLFINYVKEYCSQLKY